MSLITNLTSRRRLEQIRHDYNSNREGIAQLDAEQAKEAAASQTEAKRLSEVRAKVEQAMPDRVQALIDDWVGREQDALRMAAEAVAREQLEAQFGITDRGVVALRGVPARISSDILDRVRKRVASSTPVSWDKQHRTASAWRGAVTADAARDAGAASVTVDDVDARIAERERKLHEQRQRQNDQRKRDAGLRGYKPAA